VCYSVLQCIQTRYLTALLAHQGVLQYVAVCICCSVSVLQCVAVFTDKISNGVAGTSGCVAVCCSVHMLQFVAV